MLTPSELRHTAIERGLIPLLIGNHPIRCEGRRRRILVVEDDVVQADDVAEAIGGHCHGNLKEPHFGSVRCCTQAAAVAICHC